MGLGGLVLIDDSDSEKLPLPKQWGVDDIPVILQDKLLGKDGQIDYQLDVMTAAVGWFGDPDVYQRGTLSAANHPARLGATKTAQWL